MRYVDGDVVADRSWTDFYLQIFKVALQADTVGNRLKEVQEKSQNLATFGTDAIASTNYICSANSGV